MLALLGLVLALASREPLTEPARSAVRSIVTHDGGCDPAEIEDVLRSADVRTLGTSGGHRVVLVGLHSRCICGNVNCPYYALALEAPQPRVVLDTFAFSLDPVGAATPLPRLLGRSHDSALVTDETTYAFVRGRYTILDATRVNTHTNERKPAVMPIRFAAGGSSAMLHGSVARGWGDVYTFTASAGGHVGVGTIAGTGAVAIAIFGDGVSGTRLAPNATFTLPKSGTYQMMIESVGDAATYELRFSIK